jgi:hypothetical protein
MPPRRQEVVDDEIAVRVSTDSHHIHLDPVPALRRGARACALGNRAKVDGLEPPGVVFAGLDLEVGAGARCPQLQAQGSIDLQPLDHASFVVHALRGDRLECPPILAVAEDEVSVADAGPGRTNQAARLAAHDDLGEARPEDRGASVDADLDASAVHSCDPTTIAASSANEKKLLRSM